MSILLLTQVFPPKPGGSGRWLWELYRRLSDLGVHVVAGTTARSEPFDRNSVLPISRLSLDFPSWGLWNWGGAPYYARAFWQLRKIVSRVRPDVIHCGKCLPEGLLALSFARWRRLPFVSYVHGEELTLAATSKELRFLTRTVLHRAASLVANSRHTKQILLREWAVPDAKVAVMHPGVDTTRFVPTARDADVRRRLGWADRRVILTVGALQKRKGQDMLIRALPSIRSRCPDVLYAMIGEGWERSYLEALASDLGVGDIVQFRGVPDDGELIQCYQQADLFALPNRQVGWDFEGFGIVLLEAQACALPVIAGASGGTSETLRPSVTGEVVDCTGPEKLADAVVALLQEPTRLAAMGDHARRWAVDQFDWTARAEEARRVFGQQ